MREWSHDGRCDTGKDFGNILGMSHDYDQHLRGGALHVSLLRYNIDEDTRPFVAYSDPMGCSIVLVTRPVVQSPLDSTPRSRTYIQYLTASTTGHNRDHRDLHCTADGSSAVLTNPFESAEPRYGEYHATLTQAPRAPGWQLTRAAELDQSRRERHQGRNKHQGGGKTTPHIHPSFLTTWQPV